MDEVKKTCSFQLFNIPEEDYREFEAIARRYRGNSFAPALREMIARYYIYEGFSGLEAKVKDLEERLKECEKHGKIRQDESKTKKG